MDTRLHLLETFSMRGSDGVTYKVCGYEHLVRDESLPNAAEAHWEPTGQSEYRLASGEALDVLNDGRMRIVTSGVTLQGPTLH
jgi:hypothetical protein